jgi:hypothetical protein
MAAQLPTVRVRHAVATGVPVVSPRAASFRAPVPPDGCDGAGDAAVVRHPASMSATTAAHTHSTWSRFYRFCCSDGLTAARPAPADVARSIPPSPPIGSSLQRPLPHRGTRLPAGWPATPPSSALPSRRSKTGSSYRNLTCTTLRVAFPTVDVSTPIRSTVDHWRRVRSTRSR